MITVNLGRIGFVLRHDYVDGAECRPLDVVSRQNALWACRAATTDVPSVVSPAWMRLISGMDADVDLHMLQDTMDELNSLLAAHSQATNAHGATPDALASRIVMRGADGRAKIGGPPSDFDDIVRYGDILTMFEDLAPRNRLISTSAPLDGGGDLTQDLTISIAPAGAATADGTRGTAVYAKDSDTASRNKAATPAGVVSLLASSVRAKKTAAVTVYVRTDGNDGLTDSASGAVKTWTGVMYALEKLDITRSTLIIQFGEGEFGGVSWYAPRIPGGGSTGGYYVVIRGAGKDLTRIGASFFRYGGTLVEAQDIGFTGELSVSYGQTVNLQRCKFFGAAAAGRAATAAGGNIYFMTGTDFDGAFTYGIAAYAGGTVWTPAAFALNFAAGTAFSGAFATAGDVLGPGSVSLRGTATGSFTGKKFICCPGGMFPGQTESDLNALLPGTINGTYSGATLSCIGSEAAVAWNTMRRDGSGRAQVAAPSAAADIATKAYADGSFAKAANGYVKLPNGIILQWATITLPASVSETAWTFPVAFPSACVSVTGCPSVYKAHDAAGYGFVVVKSKSAASAGVWCFNGDWWNTAQTLYMMAVGY